ncbi:hypothetical protein RDWZM_000568 [Blomia tropicalis]|uniref:Calcium uniporter protein n=1 Tax=Blomia tropicalis TaxID=40697 RepID=A0A9Q0RN42_BLOTA|nr:hypothetical protein RDWZM_000568 [Blomia tropicalis]
MVSSLKPYHLSKLERLHKTTSNVNQICACFKRINVIEDETEHKPISSITQLQKRLQPYSTNHALTNRLLSSHPSAIDVLTNMNHRTFHTFRSSSFFSNLSVQFIQHHSPTDHLSLLLNRRRMHSADPTVRITVTFSNGHFRLLFFDQYEAVIHYWQPVDALFQTMSSEILPNSSKERPHLKDIHKFKMFNLGRTTNDSSKPGSSDLSKYRLSSSMPFGYLFCAIDPYRVQILGFQSSGLNGSLSTVEPVLFQFKIFNDTLKNIIEWGEQNSVKSSSTTSDSSSYSSVLTGSGAAFSKQELVFLEQERHLLMNKFEPLNQKFEILVKKAKAEAHRRFKLGGLFFLSLELGFVSRLTWFEYSWDIMEPVTWALTHCSLVLTFAYFMITSDEYHLPLVERRMIVNRFWKLVKSTKFDVQAYRLLRDEISNLDRQIEALKKNTII